MKNNFLLASLALALLLTCKLSWAQTPHPEPYHSIYLNDFMQQFGSWAIEIQITKFKKKKPDWLKIQADLERLSKELASINHAQKDLMFTKLHGELSKIISELKTYAASEKPDIKIFNQQVDQSCLKCHKE